MDKEVVVTTSTMTSVIRENDGAKVRGVIMDETLVRFEIEVFSEPRNLTMMISSSLVNARIRLDHLINAMVEVSDKCSELEAKDD